VTQTSPEQESPASEFALDWNDLSNLPTEEVRALFVVLSKALRAQQLYDENNPVYQRFVSQLADALADLWAQMDRLSILVEEDRFMWMGEAVYQSESRSDSLAFLLYKDGVREFTLHQGLETHELVVFLQVLNQARDLRPKGDDLLTILWEKDLKYFTYSYVDVLAEGLDLELPEGGPGFSGEFDKILREEIPPEKGAPESGELAVSREPRRQGSGQVTPEDFNPTLYSLSPMEMETVREEIRIEMERDLRGDVLAALFDRVEEPRFPERQLEILQIFRVLLPNFLSRGAFRAAGSVLEEMSRLLTSEEALQEDHKAAVEEILEQVSGDEALRELVQSLEDGSVSPDPEELGKLLRHLRSKALGPLLRGAEKTEDAGIQGTIRAAVAAIAKRFPEALLECLQSEDPAVVAGAVNLVGRMNFGEAAPWVSRLLSHESPRVRLACIGAAKNLGASMALGALREPLFDSEREVRIAAARALGELRYKPAAEPLKSILQSKELRQADLSEQIAFFESYGMIRDPEGVRLLDGFLNRRGFLGRRESGEIRACAALALGKMGTQEALEALERAANEQDPVVRSAVNRALRGEG